MVGPHPWAGVVSTREEMLGRVRNARAGAALVEPARDYRRLGEHDPGSEALLDLLEERLLDYGALSGGPTRRGFAVRWPTRWQRPESSDPCCCRPDCHRNGCRTDGRDSGSYGPTELDEFAAVVTACNCHVR